MKKKIGIFIFIVICSTVMLSDWIERIYIGRLAGLPGRYNSYVGIQKEQKDSIDMLVLGDSESMTSISPMELWKSTGITSYICGQSGQRISESYYMLKHALDYQSPQVVLLETNMLFRYTNTPDSLRSSICSLFYISKCFVCQRSTMTTRSCRNTIFRKQFITDLC